MKVDTTMMVRIVSGVLAVVVLFIIIWRRKRKAME
jgi:preprotein translocase subunit YajC